MKTTNHPLLITFSVLCFAFLPGAQAVGPDTDGAIPGSNNGEGIGVLVSRTTGVWNTGTGFEALNSLTSGNQNTATGLRALFNDINGGFNTATGVYSLYTNASGFYNCATGAYSLSHNTTADGNTANGYSALYFNSDGESNTATGFAALYKNTDGPFNVASGASALFNNIAGGSNVATGEGALYNNTNGSGNTAIGRQALFNNNNLGSFNTAVGFSAGSNLTNGSGNVCIGAMVGGEAGVTNSTYIRNVYSSVANARQVYVNSNNKIGTLASTRRVKDDIEPMAKASETILALRPVTFRYKKEIDGYCTPQFGLVAEEVAEVNPDLVTRDTEGKPETVRYDAVNAMLLSEFLKEHKTVQDQGATIAELKKEISALTAMVKEQAAQIQKVRAQLEATNPAPQIALNIQ